MKKSAGYTRNEILEIVKENAPKFIKVNVKEEEDHLELVLNYKDSVIRHSAIWKTSYREDLKETEEEEILKKVRSKTREKIVRDIKNLGEKIAFNIIQHFQLDDVFKQRYEDRNVRYKIRKEYSIEEQGITEVFPLDLFYNYKFKKLAPNLQLLWKKLWDNKGEAQQEKLNEILEYLHGARERFKLLLFAKDQIVESINSNPKNNDIWFLVVYNFFHFISLVKTLGDNLAWILRLNYNGDQIRDIKERPMNTDLTREVFKDFLEDKEAIYDCIYRHKNYSEFEILKKFRNIVQHRHLLHIVGVKIGCKGPVKVMIPTDPESGLLADSLRTAPIKFKPLANVMDKKSIVEYGLKEVACWLGPQNEMFFEDPDDYCSKYVQFLLDVYEAVSKEILEEISHSQD